MAKRKTISLLLVLVGVIILLLNPVFNTLQIAIGEAPYYDVNGVIVYQGDVVDIYGLDLDLTYHDSREDIHRVVCYLDSQQDQTIYGQTITVFINLTRSSATTWIGAASVPIYDQYKLYSTTIYTAGSDPFSYVITATLNIRAPPPTVGFVRGYVFDEENTAIPDVKVTVGDKSVLSNEAGSYLIDNLAPGEYEVKAEKQGWQTYSGNVTVTAGVTRSHTIRLQPSSNSLALTISPYVGVGLIFAGVTSFAIAKKREV